MAEIFGNWLEVTLGSGNFVCILKREESANESHSRPGHNCRDGREIRCEGASSRAGTAAPASTRTGRGARAAAGTRAAGRGRRRRGSKGRRLGCGGRYTEKA